MSSLIPSPPCLLTSSSEEEEEEMIDRKNQQSLEEMIDRKNQQSLEEMIDRKNQQSLEEMIDRKNQQSLEEMIDRKNQQSLEEMIDRKNQQSLEEMIDRKNQQSLEEMIDRKNQNQNQNLATVTAATTAQSLQSLPPNPTTVTATNPYSIGHPLTTTYHHHHLLNHTTLPLNHVTNPLNLNHHFPGSTVTHVTAHHLTAPGPPPQGTQNGTTIQGPGGAVTTTTTIPGHQCHLGGPGTTLHLPTTTGLDLNNLRYLSESTNVFAAAGPGGGVGLPGGGSTTTTFPHHHHLASTVYHHAHAAHHHPSSAVALAAAAQVQAQAQAQVHQAQVQAAAAAQAAANQSTTVTNLNNCNANHDILNTQNQNHQQIETGNITNNLGPLGCQTHATQGTISTGGGTVTTSACSSDSMSSATGTGGQQAQHCPQSMQLTSSQIMKHNQNQMNGQNTTVLSQSNLSGGGHINTNTNMSNLNGSTAGHHSQCQSLTQSGTAGGPVKGPTPSQHHIYAELNAAYELSSSLNSLSQNSQNTSHVGGAAGNLNGSQQGGGCNSLSHTQNSQQLSNTLNDADSDIAKTISNPNSAIKIRRQNPAIAAIYENSGSNEIHGNLDTNNHNGNGIDLMDQIQECVNSSDIINDTNNFQNQMQTMISDGLVESTLDSATIIHGHIPNPTVSHSGKSGNSNPGSVSVPQSHRQTLLISPEKNPSSKHTSKVSVSVQQAQQQQQDITAMSAAGPVNTNSTTGPATHTSLPPGLSLTPAHNKFCTPVRNHHNHSSSKNNLSGGGSSGPGSLHSGSASHSLGPSLSGATAQQTLGSLSAEHHLLNESRNYSMGYSNTNGKAHLGGGPGSGLGGSGLGGHGGTHSTLNSSSNILGNHSSHQNGSINQCNNTGSTDTIHQTPHVNSSNHNTLNSGSKSENHHHINNRDSVTTGKKIVAATPSTAGAVTTAPPTGDHHHHHHYHHLNSSTNRGNLNSSNIKSGSSLNFNSNTPAMNLSHSGGLSLGGVALGGGSNNKSDSRSLAPELAQAALASQQQQQAVQVQQELEAAQALNHANAVAAAAAAQAAAAAASGTLSNLQNQQQQGGGGANIQPGVTVPIAGGAQFPGQVAYYTIHHTNPTTGEYMTTQIPGPHYYAADAASNINNITNSNVTVGQPAAQTANTTISNSSSTTKLPPHLAANFLNQPSHIAAAIAQRSLNAQVQAAQAQAHQPHSITHIPIITSAAGVHSTAVGQCNLGGPNHHHHHQIHNGTHSHGTNSIATAAAGGVGGIHNSTNMAANQHHHLAGHGGTLGNNLNLGPGGLTVTASNLANHQNPTGAQQIHSTNNNNNMGSYNNNNKHHYHGNNNNTNSITGGPGHSTLNNIVNPYHNFHGGLGPNLNNNNSNTNSIIMSNQHQRNNSSVISAQLSANTTGGNNSNINNPNNLNNQNRPRPETSGKFLCMYILGIRLADPFDCAKRIIGPDGFNVKLISHIVQGCKVRLRGEGFQNELDSAPCQLNVSVPTKEGYIIAKYMVSRLLERIFDDYYHWSGGRFRPRINCQEHPLNEFIDPVWERDFKKNSPWFHNYPQFVTSVRMAKEVLALTDHARKNQQNQNGGNNINNSGNTNNINNQAQNQIQNQNLNQNQSLVNNNDHHVITTPPPPPGVHANVELSEMSKGGGSNLNSSSDHFSSSPESIDSQTHSISILNHHHNHQNLSTMNHNVTVNHANLHLQGNGQTAMVQ